MKKTRDSLCALFAHLELTGNSSDDKEEMEEVLSLLVGDDKDYTPFVFFPITTPYCIKLELKKEVKLKSKKFE